MSKEEILCKFIEYDDIENVELLLNQGELNEFNVIVRTSQ